MATNPDWPGIDTTESNGITGATGSGFRGGGWNSSTTSDLQTSDRNLNAETDTTKGINYGGRGCRTGPYHGEEQDYQ